MEQTKKITGSFAEFRAGLIEEYNDARAIWSESVDVSSSDSLLAYDKMEQTKAEIHEIECVHIEKQLGKSLLPLGLKIYNDILGRERVWKEAELGRLEELRKQGVSYTERMEKINAKRLRTFLLVDKGDITMNEIELRPVSEWLEPIIGYVRLKDLGITAFVQANFALMFNIKK